MGIVISGVKSRVTMIITHFRRLITPLVTAHEPASRAVFIPKPRRNEGPFTPDPKPLIVELFFDSNPLSEPLERALFQGTRPRDNPEGPKIPPISNWANKSIRSIYIYMYICIYLFTYLFIYLCIYIYMALNPKPSLNEPLNPKLSWKAFAAPWGKAFQPGAKSEKSYAEICN